MKKNKKGFTLVELLAVIVILGVLLMIAVPAIQNVINKSRRNAFIDQAKLAVENVETMISVTEEITMPTGATSCVIPVTDIKLDRGSWSGYKGTVTVTKLDAPDDNGKYYKATISLSDGTYSITNGNTTTEEVDSNYTEATTASSKTCAWYE